jgi:uncharacterized protein (TIRG00374 family)
MGRRSGPVPPPRDVSLPTPAAEPGPSLEQQGERPFPWKVVARRAAVVLVAGIAIYLLVPTLLRVFSAFPRLFSLDAGWFAFALVAEAGHFACTFALQRLALRTKDWLAVSTSTLVGNGITLIVPGGAAAGAAVQFRMLRTSGLDTATAVGGLTTFSLLTVAGLLGLPIFALVASVVGVPVNHGLFEAAVVGVVAFVLFVGFGIVLFTLDRPLAAIGRLGQWLWNHVVRTRQVTGVDRLLMRERDTIRRGLGEKWRAAVVLTAGRLVLDYLCLLGMVRATGAHPQWSLVLLAFAVAGAIGLVPITPGGLGIVEASLSGLLILAGMGAGDAFLATLAYRLASYWLPLLVSPFAYGLFRWRYGPADGRATAP